MAFKTGDNVTVRSSGAAGTVTAVNTETGKVSVKDTASGSSRDYTETELQKQPA